MTNNGEHVIYHPIDSAVHAHVLQIDFPESHDNELVTAILMEAGKGERHAHFFNRSGVYIYFLTHNDEEKVYVGQATHLESRALNKARLKRECVSRVLLFSTKRKNQFNEAEIQHLEYYILRRLNNSNKLVKNAQSVSPSIGSKKLTGGVEDWFTSMDDYLEGRFAGVFDNADPVGFDVEIELRERDNVKQYCIGRANFNPTTKRVQIIADKTVASHGRWMVPKKYQEVKTDMISTGLLKLKAKAYGKHSHDGYEFTGNLVLMNITEATAIILNQPQASNQWYVVETGEKLQKSKHW